MKVHDLYRSVRVKALEVCEALTAVEKVRGMSGPSATIDEIVTHFTTYRLFPFEVDIQKDTRRHVKLLYADYCTLRDELIALLTSNIVAGSGEQHRCPGAKCDNTPPPTPCEARKCPAPLAPRKLATGRYTTECVCVQLPGD